MRLGITAFLTDLAMRPAALARAVEERGFASLFLPEHTHLPVRSATPPSLVEGVDLEDYRRSLDPLVALASAVEATEHIRLGTGIVLVAQHDPIVLAKQVATLDLLSNGRVDLGVGFGWNRAEAEDHGIPFEIRRQIAAEHVRCMQALWSEERASFSGDRVHLEPCWSWPKPVQRPGVPVLVGGSATDAVFEAVADYGQGWMPIGGAGVAKALPRLRKRLEDSGRDPSTVRVIPFGTVPSEKKLEHFASAGIDEVVLRLPAGPTDAMLRHLDELARFVR
jgi:probable F420-dependent oxidoreductase